MIDLYRDADRISEVSIHSSRPFQAVHLLRGKPPEAALSAVALMYNVCANAQAQAGLQACRQALGYKTSDDVVLAQQMLVDLETLREHLWRMSVEWPRLLGETISPRATLLSIIMTACRQSLFARENPFALTASLNLDAKTLHAQLEDLQAFVEVEVLAAPLQEWLEEVVTSDLLMEWARKQQTVAARMLCHVHDNCWMTVGNVEVNYLPPFEQTALLQQFQTDDVSRFIAEPTWQGECYETTTFSRQNEAPLLISMSARFGTGLLTRLVAKLLEVVTLLAKLKVDTEQLIEAAQEPDVTFEAASRASWTGIGQVEAARGRLVHWVEIKQGKIKDYRILAPTEWNFHPRGIAVAGLKTLSAASEDELRQQATYWINAIDPCVGYEVRVHRGAPVSME